MLVTREGCGTCGGKLLRGGWRVRRWGMHLIAKCDVAARGGSVIVLDCGIGCQPRVATWFLL